MDEAPTYFFTGKTENGTSFLCLIKLDAQVEHSVALESDLEHAKTQHAEIKITKPQNNLSGTQRGQSPKGVKKKNNLAVALKRADRDNDSYHEEGRKNIRGQGATR